MGFSWDLSRPMKLARIAAIVFGIYLALGLVLDAAIGYFQPQRGNTAVLRTFDPDGQQPRETVLGLLDDHSQLWVESGHWWKGWYHRVQANPNVELIRDGVAKPYHAVPVDSDAALDTVTRLMGKGTSARYWVGRAVLLWAPIRPVRLDPR